MHIILRAMVAIVRATVLTTLLVAYTIAFSVAALAEWLWCGLADIRVWLTARGDLRRLYAFQRLESEAPTAKRLPIQPRIPAVLPAYEFDHSEALWTLPEDRPLCPICAMQLAYAGEYVARDRLGALCARHAYTTLAYALQNPEGAE